MPFWVLGFFLPHAGAQAPKALAVRPQTMKEKTGQKGGKRGVFTTTHTG